MIRAWSARVGDPGREALPRLRSALGDEAAGSLEDGPFAIAWSGPGPAEREGVICLVDGHLHALGSLRERHGAAPDEPDEALVALAWRRDGDAALEGLRGDFAMVLWDRTRLRGRVVRDPLGGRGVFLHAGGRSLLLGSEIHRLLPLLDTRPAPEPRALMHWVTDRVLRGPGTLHSGIERLPPAHLLVLGETGARPRRWWAPPPPDRRRAGSAAEAAEQVRDAATTAIGRRAPAEGGGVLLSGGFDSGSVAALAARAGTPLRAYSAVFPDHPGMDESSLIQEVGEAAGGGGFQMPARAGSALPAARDYAAEFKMPLFSPNLHFMRALMGRAAGDGVGVLLDGEGGDELFGVEPYLLADRLRKGRLASAFGLARRLPGAGAPTPRRLALRALRTYGLIGALPARIEHAERRRRARGRGPAKPWLAPSAARLLGGWEPSADWKRRGLPRWRAHLEDILLSARDDVGVGQLLRLQAELSGVEGRHPFLHDADLVALMLTLPPELSFDASLDRPLARRAVDGVLPDVVRLRREKTLFDEFVFSCLTGPDLEPMRKLVGDPSAEINAWVDRDAVRRELIDVDPRRHPRGIHLWATEIWRLATTELWLRS